MSDKKQMTLLCLTPEERELLKQLAQADGCTLTELVRRALTLYAKVGMIKIKLEN